MTRVLSFVGALVMACGVLVIAQNVDVKKVLSDVHDALGGDQKLAAVKTLTATGRSARVSAETSAPATDFELAMDLPGKFMKKEVLGVMMGAEITRTSGFNDNALIEAMDTPPGMFGGGGGHMIVRSAGGSTFEQGPGATPPTPAQRAEDDRLKVLASKQDFARLTLGMFANSFSSYPLHFTYAGQAESPDGKADILDVTGEGGFAARLFVDGRTHLPLLVSWMAKEPVSLNTGGAVTMTPGASGVTSRTFVAGGGGTVATQGGQQSTPEERERMIKQMQDRLKEAQANAKMVEYRLYYGDFQKVDGVNLPFHLQRSIDGNLVEDLTFEKIKINPKIDPKKFDVKKSS
jgi:hypothetical protein